MNVSTIVIYQDTWASALAKNVLILGLGLVINYVNGTLVHTFRKHQIFYTNPRYILFIHLVLNDMIQLTLSTVLFVLSKTGHIFVASLCMLLLTVAVWTTHNTPLTLAGMALECYVAVCFPLQHARLCTIRKTYILIGCIWFLGIMTVLPDVFIMVAIKSPKFFDSIIYCERTSVFGHPDIMLKRDVQYIVYLSVVWFIVIYTYCHIFFAAKSKSGEGEVKKATNTILLHGFQLFLCTLTYLFHIIVKELVYLFIKYSVHIAFVAYILILILPRLISPLVYGVRDKTFRQHLKKYIIIHTVILRSGSNKIADTQKK